MTKAKKIIEVPEWRNETFFSGVRYNWLSPKEVIYSVGSAMDNPKYFRQSLGSERIIVQPLIADQRLASSYDMLRIIVASPKYRGVIEFSSPENMNVTFERTDGSGQKRLRLQSIFRRI